MSAVLRPEDACQKRFSWFFNWIPKVQKAWLLCCGLMVSSPGPWASSGGRLPEAFLLVFRMESQGAKVCKS